MAIKKANEFCLEIKFGLWDYVSSKGLLLVSLLVCMHLFNNTGNECDDLLTFKVELMTS